MPSSRSAPGWPDTSRANPAYAQSPNHNTPVQTKPPAQPIIGLAGLLGMVELAQRLRTSPNAERQERATCLTEQFPPASRQGVPTDMGAATAAEPQASGPY